MIKSTNHQCPNCTGPLRFDPKTNLLTCDYCGSSFDISQIDEKYAEKINDSVEKGTAVSEEEAAQAEAEGTSTLKTYTCSSCGAQLFCDEVTVASSCPYCGNPNVIAGKFGGGQMPDLVIPFKLEKKDAVAALTKFYKGKVLLPRVFKAQNHIEEIKGIYVPFWLYSGTADIHLTATAETSSVAYTSKEKITTISHFNCERSGTVPFDKVPVDASLKMDNAMMDSLEPFNYGDLKNFTPSYLPGFLAEAYDDSAEECEKRMRERVEESAKDEMVNDITGYDSVHVKESTSKLTMPEKPKYAFFPVYLLSTKWKDKNYLFAMNGQTGKMVGKLPMSGGRFVAWLFGIFGIGTLILTPILYLFFR